MYEFDGAYPKCQSLYAINWAINDVRKMLLFKNIINRSKELKINTIKKIDKNTNIGDPV